MKKVKLSEIGGKRWDVSDQDRKRLDDQASTRASTRSMERYAEANAEIAKKVGELVHAIANTPPVTVTSPPMPKMGPVEIVLPVAGKKKYRFNVFRDDNGFIDHVDVEEL